MTQVLSPQADTTPRVLPGPSDEAAWSDFATVERIAHRHIHQVPQPGCDRCPPVACRCGAAGCPDVFDHSRVYAGAELTWREDARVSPVRHEAA